MPAADTPLAPENFAGPAPVGWPRRSEWLQLTITPAGWAVSKRGGSVDPESVVTGKFSPPKELNRTYRFEMDAADGTVTVRVPGAEKTTKLGTIGLLVERHRCPCRPSEPTAVPP